MVIAIVPALVLIVGLLMWAFGPGPKLQEAGRIMFFCGMFVITWILSKESIHIG